METSPIFKVAVLTDGCTAIYPQSTKADHQYVYREAAGVHWDQKMGCFVSTPPREWTPQMWYKQIIAIVRSGVGLEMLLTPETKFESKDEGFEESIKIADEEVRAFIKEAEQAVAPNSSLPPTLKSTSSVRGLED